MILVKEALAQILENFSPLPTETVAIADSLGRLLAEPVAADRDYPAFDNSAMDGIAVIAADSQDASQDQPVRLDLVGSIPAGEFPSQTLTSNQAIQIMTGAPLPPGADAVIPVEKTNLDFSKPVTEQEVLVYLSPKPGDNIRRQGIYYTTDQPLIAAGQTIRPQEVAMFATVGKAEVRVVRRPHIGVLSTGDELVSPGLPLSPGKIRDSNSYLLASLLETSGAAVSRSGIIPDRREAIIEALDAMVEKGVDLIVTSGGVSMGVFDLVRQVLETEGTLQLWKVNMRPGKPVAFGRYKGVAFIGLPGNPISAFVGYHVFVRPILQKMSGVTPVLGGTETAILTESVHSDGRETYIPATLTRQGERWVVQPTPNNNSGNLYALIPGNSLIIMPVGVKFLNKNEIVDVRLLD